MIVVIGGEKGGTGKTTIATNLAVSLAQQEKDVLLVDADPQSNSANWVSRRQGREDEPPEINCVQKIGDIRKTVMDLNKRYSYVVVDTGGRDSLELRSAMAVADIFYCPLRASQPDLETIPKLVRLIQEMRTVNTALVTRSLLSMASTNTFIRNEVESAQAFLGEYVEHLPVSSCVIRDRKTYRDAMIDGLGVLELQNDIAHQEVRALATEVFG